jgi:predicted RNase H-like HicB family nuclease
MYSGVEFDEALNDPHEGSQMLKYKVIVERHPDGYVAYPLGIKGVVVGQGDTYEQALSDLKSAIEFHIETFGPEADLFLASAWECWTGRLSSPIMMEIK